MLATPPSPQSPLHHLGRHLLDLYDVAVRDLCALVQLPDRLDIRPLKVAVANFEQRAADISVEHPYVVSHYREARTIAGAAERGEASTEDIRRALKHYRALFVELLGPVSATDGRRSVEAIR